MRILVVSFAFPPFNCIGAVRVGKTVKALRRHGHEVRVLSAADQPFPASLPLEIPAGEVAYTRWLDLRHPGRGFRPPPPPAASTPRSSGEAPEVRRAATWRYAASRLYGSMLFVPDAFAGWLPYALAEGDRLVRSFRPDVVFASAIPYTCLAVGAILARRHHLPWVAELRDLWSGHHAYWHYPFRRPVDRFLERAILASAAGVVTVSEPLAEALRGITPAPVVTMLNGYDPEDWPREAPAAADGEGLTLTYTGNLLAGQRDPAALFQALRTLPPGSVKVRFVGQTLTAVPDLARAAGVEDAVTLSGAVPYRESLRLQAGSDVLLFLLWDQGGRHGLYSGKIFEYLASRRPILALGPRNDVAEDLILARGAGVALETPEAIAAQLGRWLDEKRRTGRVAPVPESARAGLSRDEQVRTLESLLDLAVRRGAP